MREAGKYCLCDGRFGVQQRGQVGEVITGVQSCFVRPPMVDGGHLEGSSL